MAAHLWCECVRVALDETYGSRNIQHKATGTQLFTVSLTGKGKGVPRQAEVGLGVPGRLRPRINSTFGTTRVVGRQPYAPAVLTPGEIPGTHFQGTWFCRKEPRKKSPVTPPGIDPGTARLVTQRLNHYATLGPFFNGWDS